MSYAKKSIDTLEKINNKVEEQNEMSFIVLKDSNIKTIQDAFSKEIATAESFDKENTEKILSEYRKKYSSDLKTKDFANYILAANSLMNKESEVMLLNESFRSILEESIDGFTEKTRVLDSKVVEGKKITTQNKKQVEEDKAFNVYISGIDTYGSLSTVSRSDVNMILSVNPVKNKILITTIPRDTYLAIGGDNNKYDKLTHAGLFGVDTSIKSLESLLDIDIDYYGKVNFTSLTELINALGGIKVDNPVAFESSSGKYYFPQGKIDMDGDMALAFSRERYHLEEGDFDRGKNHARVLTGIINKMLSYDMLINFNQISNIVLESVNTDIAYDKMIELVNKQLSDGGDWDIETQALKGWGESGLISYLMPDFDLYMMRVDEDSVTDVHDKIIENNRE
ncbi:LCP family protein [Anaerococcus prevotii]|uniref:Cell envelope-like function transcriptional attenuator common domain protein n=1 Tax=Anaerococcus prevotii ACS-065-V-Col13 TaxID=879305 RepID=F0GT83_9FIRM|nr:LCP family protein [Anaerococcus prevotii]EGC82946.1 cell envelope-like function transcriptional attenuator common domain protein [Anaerococcus prevotii ACS-065-V-Col13]